MEYNIDINADLGEGFLFDEELMEMISSCNIACGGHTGTESSIRSSVLLAKKHNVTIGAHPSYPDPENFGRKEMDIPNHLLVMSLEKQIHTILNIAKQEGVVVRYIKPHGALYNKAAYDVETATLLVDIVSKIEPSVALMGLSGSLLEQMAKKRYLMFISEGFADRKYNNDGTLVSRTNTKALIEHKEEVWQQVKAIVLEHQTKSIDHQEIEINVESICFHGDSPEALEQLTYVCHQLKKAKIEIKNAV